MVYGPGYREEAIGMTSRMTGHRITRRTMLLSLGVMAALPLVEACTPGVPASRPAERKPAETKPAAPAAPPAPAAPAAAAKPTEAAKPAAPAAPAAAAAPATAIVAPTQAAAA